MNLLSTKVYREPKMRILFLLLLLPVQSLFAQKDYMPFELERFPPPYYQSIIDRRDTAFTSEQEAMDYYFLAYKLQRSENSNIYFPSPNQQRRLASAYLNKEYENGAALSLIDFLESSGNLPSANEILSEESDYKMLLPYKFIAAMLTQNTEKAANVLENMNTEGMLSPVLKSFGKNSLASVGDKKIVITQGIQDLIAIYYAMETGTSLEIQNLFLEQCGAFAGRRINSTIENDNVNVWVAPTTDYSKLQISEPMQLQGVGFVFNTDVEILSKSISTVGLHFEGLDDKAGSPADKGLLRSYLYFSNAFSNYAVQYGSKKEKQAADTITELLKQSDK